MRKLALASLLAAAVVVPTAIAAPTRVILKDDYFKPKSVTIKKDQRVRFVWRGENVHNVVIKRKGNVVRRSKYMTKGEFTHRFRRRGTYNTICEVHPITMTGKVVVK